jgi:Rieske 2Fe-2S family protein
MNETDVVCQFLVLPDQSVEMAGAVEFWDLTNRQDWQVCQWAQTGMEDSAYQPGPYSNLESIVAVFDRHYLSALDNGNGRESTGQSCRV